MASTFRQRATNKEDAFIEAAETSKAKQTTEAAQGTEVQSVEQRIEQRAQGRKYPFYSLRGTESQAELLKYAAKKKGMSQNELVLTYLFEALEVEFGSEVPIK